MMAVTINFIRNGIIHRIPPLSLMLAILLGGCNIFGALDNPIDPKSDAYKSPAKAITSFSIVNPSVTGTIDETTKTIELTVPYGTSPNGLKATFMTTGASVRVGSTLQVSGITVNNFTNPVIYEVTAEDGSKTTYTVDVTVASSSAKAITSFSIASLSVAGIIDENARTITLTVPYGTSISSLIASFSTSGSSVSVNGIAQVSNSTSNDFTESLVYEVSAADGTTQSYTVTVTVAADPAKSITSFNFSSPVAVGIVTESNHTVSVTVPYGTSVTSLVPTIQITGATISPASGTSRNFTNPVSYTVTAADGSIQVYTITVTVAANSAKEITSIAFSNPSAIGVVTESNHTIAITVPFGTTVTSLTPTIGISGASISPASGAPQNFTSPVTYTVTAADSTTQTYIVTVTIALNPAKAITNFELTSLGVIGAVTESNHTIALTVPYGTSVASLTPTIGITGASISPASGVARNFTSPVTYTVTAADGSIQDYLATIYISLPSYTISISQPTDGIISITPSKDFYTLGEAVTINCTPNSGYNFSGWAGDISGSLNPFVFTITNNINISASFSLIPLVVATPVFTPTAGIYAGSQAVSITTTTSLSTIRYTLDGSTPSSLSGRIYTTPITVEGTWTIKAIAYRSGYESSSISSAKYSIDTSNTIPRAGLIAEWMMTGNADDSSGTGNGLTSVNALLDVDRFGNTQSALLLSGTNSYASSSMTITPSPGWAVSEWVKISSIPTSSTILFCVGNGVNPNMLFQVSNSNGLWLRTGINNGAFYSVVDSSYSNYVDKWVNIVFVYPYDVSEAPFYVYINGAFAGSTNLHFSQ